MAGPGNTATPTGRPQCGNKTKKAAQRTRTKQHVATKRKRAHNVPRQNQTGRGDPNGATPARQQAKIPAQRTGTKQHVATKRKQPHDAPHQNQTGLGNAARDKRACPQDLLARGEDRAKACREQKGPAACLSERNRNTKKQENNSGVGGSRAAANEREREKPRRSRRRSQPNW